MLRPQSRRRERCCCECCSRECSSRKRRRCKRCGFAAAAQRAAGAAVPIGTMVPNLPSGCSSIVISGVNYFNCAGVYYRAGFQGNNIVYIVSAP